MPHVEFSYTGASPNPLVATGAFEAVYFLDLYVTGDMEGDDSSVGGTDGRNPRDRKLDYLAAEIVWEIRGGTDIDGTATVGDKTAQLRKNVRDVTRWFNSAPGKRFTVKVVEDDASTEEADAAHSMWTRWRWHGQLAKATQLVYVAAGKLSPP